MLTPVIVTLCTVDGRLVDVVPGGGGEEGPAGASQVHAQVEAGAAEHCCRGSQAGAA